MYKFRSYQGAGESRYAPRLTSEDWESHKEIVRKLVGEGKTRHEILSRLRSEYHFNPSLGQLTAKLGNWGLQRTAKAERDNDSPSDRQGPHSSITETELEFKKEPGAAIQEITGGQNSRQSPTNSSYIYGASAPDDGYFNLNESLYLSEPLRAARYPKRSSHTFDSESGVDSVQSVEPAREFACPYWAAYPILFRDCASKKLVTIAALKQHLGRVHKRPDYYCPTCYKGFETKSEWLLHVEAFTCDKTPNPFAEEMRMNDDIFRKIKFKRRGLDPRTAWYRIFDLLFPNTPRPSSPYASDLDNAKSVTHFVDFFRCMGPSLARSAYESTRSGLLGKANLPETSKHIIDRAYAIFLEEQSNTESKFRDSESNPILGEPFVSLTSIDLAPLGSQFEKDELHRYLDSFEPTTFSNDLENDEKDMWHLCDEPADFTGNMLQL